MPRRRNRRRRRCEDSGFWWPSPPSNIPSPPSKEVFRKHPEPHYERVPTEVHRALVSLGSDEAVNKLSDGEFYSQLFDEFGYLASKSRAHFSNAVDAFIDLCRAIF